MKSLVKEPHLMRGGQETFDMYRAIKCDFSEAAFNIVDLFSFPLTPLPHFQRPPPPNSRIIHFFEQKIKQKQQEAYINGQGAPDEYNHKGEECKK